MAPAWIRGFVAGRGSGKTLIGARDVLLRARADEPWMSVSPSYGVLYETTMPTVVEEARRLGVFISKVQTPLPRVVFRTQDGGQADLVMRSGDNPENLRGPNKAGLWIDEASLTCHDVMLLGMAVLRHEGRMGPLTLTFTPKGRRHWTFDVFYERVDVGWDEWIEERADGRYLARLVDDSDAVTYRPIYQFAGLDYVRTKNTHLVHADTRDNPFLPQEFYTNIRQHYSAQLAEQELGGMFVDIEGLLFKRQWFELVDQVPRDAQRVRYWDRAGTEGGGSYSAGVLMARDRQGIFYVEDVVRGQWSPGDRNKRMQQVAEDDARRYGNTVNIYVEQEGGSGGKEVAQQALVDLASYPVFVDVVSGPRVRRKDQQALPGEAKVVRAQPVAAQAEAGNVRIKRGAWNDVYLEELTAFPEWVHDDQVDGTSGALNKLAMLTASVDSDITRTTVDGWEQSSSRFGVHFDRTRKVDQGRRPRGPEERRRNAR